MRQFFCQGSAYQFFFTTSVLAVLLHVAPPAWSSPQAGSVVVPGGHVAATPISIPRPIHLEKIMQLPDINKINSIAGGTQTTAPVSRQDQIKSCDLVGIHGKEITLRLQYRINPIRHQPIYAGAWLYDRSGQSIDAGYKPVAIRNFPNGSIDVVLVLPDQDFRSDYLVTFLMEAGKPVFVNGRFKMAYSWQDGVLSEANESHMSVTGKPAMAQPENIADFCKKYAQKAVAQYRFAISNHLPGIVPPVWSDDLIHHYNWCLGVPRDNADQGTALRQAHIDRYKYLVDSNASELAIPDKPGAKTMQSMDKAKIHRPAPNKQLDPGLGP